MTGVRRMGSRHAIGLDTKLPRNVMPSATRLGIAGIGPAEHDVFAGGLEVVVLDRVRPRTVPSADRLRILTDTLAVRDMRVANGDGGRIEGDTALLTPDRVAMDVEVAEDDVVRHFVAAVLRARPVAYPHDLAVALVAGAKFEIGDTPVMRASCSPKRRIGGSRGAQSREERRVRWPDPVPGGRQHRVRCRRAQRDPLIARFDR